MAVNLSGVLNTDSEFFLEVHEDVADVLLWKRELSLRTLALAGHVQGKPLLRAGGVAESGARVVVWALRLEGHAAGDLSVWPDLALEGLDGENLILEEHWVVLNCLSDTLVLPLECGDSLLLSTLLLGLQFGLIVRVITVETVFSTLVLILTLEHSSLF